MSDDENVFKWFISTTLKRRYTTLTDVEIFEIASKQRTQKQSLDFISVFLFPSLRWNDLLMWSVAWRSLVLSQKPVVVVVSYLHDKFLIRTSMTTNLVLRDESTNSKLLLQIKSWDEQWECWEVIYDWSKAKGPHERSPNIKSPNENSP